MSKDTTKNMSEIKFFITGGGTGGHIYPAVSVINGLLEKGAQLKNIFYVGNKKNLEYKISNENGYNFLSTSVFGMPRKMSFKFIWFMVCLFVSILKCLYYCLKYRPNVVFATGGYVCAPVLFASRILNIPYVMHDSDCFPGIVTRTFAGGAAAINLAFLDAKKYINSKNVYNFNNPVRSAFFASTKEGSRKLFNIKNEFLILIMGGSQGAKSINDAAIELIKSFSNKENIKIILQTGRKNYDEVTGALEIPSNATVQPYFDDMSKPILAADLIVSRAGSISISEILSAKTPSILVPYPYAAADHQRINARAIEKAGAAIYLEDNDIKQGALEKAVLAVISDKEKYQNLKTRASELGKNFEFATEKIVNLILKAIK